MNTHLPYCPDIEEFRDKIHPRVLLHHSWRKLEEIGDFLRREGLRDDVWELLVCEDFPMVNIRYKGHDITLATTRMGVDPSLWIVDQLATCGAERIIKVGTFLALAGSTIDLGDILVPERAVAPPGPIEAYLGPGHLEVEPDQALCKAILERRPSLKQGVILTYPVVRLETDHPEYNVAECQEKHGCVGLEMECAAVFSVAQYYRIQAAAMLVCNRLWGTLLCEKQGTGHRAEVSRPDQYDANYDTAVLLALETLAFGP
jgi:uridine phosphorylase